LVATVFCLAVLDNLSDTSQDSAVYSLLTTAFPEYSTPLPQEGAAADRLKTDAIISTITTVKPKVEAADAAVRSKKVKSYTLPEACTPPQMEEINMQLSPKKCTETQKKPYEQRCSFTQASKCPDPIWLSNFHKKNQRLKHPFLSFFVGCNKAIDAVNTLRMGSKDPKFDVQKWATILTHGGKSYSGSSCGNLDKNGRLAKDLEVNISGQAAQPGAQVYCFEPVVATFQELNRTKHTIGWGDELVLERVALSNEPGVIHVPTMGVALGKENFQINSDKNICETPEAQKSDQCLSIPVNTIDNYMKNVGDSRPIHYLSIDVEGYDFNVIKGAQKTLERVHYLEFEYNWVGPWAKQQLADAIDLFKSKDFVCYFPGVNGNIWRITDCWQEFYAIHSWANVACVNYKIPEAAPLAKRMEKMFLKTLKRKNVTYG
jgi:FkbM family methyltransferase